MADRDGYYNIPVEARQFTLTVLAPGYFPTTRTVTVIEGSTNTIDVALQSSWTVFLPLVTKP